MCYSMIFNLTNLMFPISELLTKGLKKPYNIFICFTCPKFAKSLKDLREHTLTEEHAQKEVLNMASNQIPTFRYEVSSKVTKFRDK